MEPIATLHDYVAQQDQLDREARVLFPYEFSECSYEKGYVKQQVFSCLTCSPTDSAVRGGMCYSCSIMCHGAHNLVELFNRRAFRCDCGSSRTGLVHCKLKPEPIPENDKNRYNDNFQNIFCYCKSAYDPEKEEGTMFQCIACEDWFHDRCIASQETLPSESSFEEYICSNCVTSNPFLKRYAGRVDIARQFYPSETASSSAPEAMDPGECHKRPADAILVSAEKKVKGHRGNSLENPSQKRAIRESCQIADLDAFECPKTPFSLFLVRGFREHLCRCEACLTRFRDLPALFYDEEIYDPPSDDDIGQSTEQAGKRALDDTLRSMPREKAIEGILAFDKLKSRFKAFLEPLAQSGEIVTEQHVKSFFEKK